MNQDVVAVISNHHSVLRWLAGRLEDSAPAATRRVLFDEFAKALGGHVRAIDEVVIPALRAAGWRKVSSSLLVGHVDLKHRLGDVLTLPCQARSRDVALAALALRLEMQLQREAGQLLPLLSELDAWQRAQLGAEVQDHLDRVLGDGPSGFADSEPAAALLEEAKLVLGTFPVLQ